MYLTIFWVPIHFFIQKLFFGWTVKLVYEFLSSFWEKQFSLNSIVVYGMVQQNAKFKAKTKFISIGKVGQKNVES